MLARPNGRHRRVSQRRSGATTAKRLAVVAVVPAVLVGAAALPSSAAVPVPSAITFSGAGWGHGVGLSQVGARGMAAEGKSAKQILTHYFTGTTVSSYKDSSDIRVNLRNMVSGVAFRGEAIAPGGGTLALTIDTKKVKVPGGVSITTKRSALKVAVYKGSTLLGTGSKVTVQWAGTRSPGGAGSKASMLNLVQSGSSFTTAGHRYRYGYVEIRAKKSTSDGSYGLQAVNSLRLHDEYLLGISEVSSSWPTAALQAQAIAARGYALVKLAAGVRGGCWCNVDRGTSDQVFVGYRKETDPSGSRWRAAVLSTNTSSTTSQTVLYKGKPAQTFFSSSTGGRTQNSEDVWGSKVAYLRSVDDHWSLDARYNPSNDQWGPVSRSQSDVAKAFGLKDVVRLDLSRRNASGAVSVAVAWSAAGKQATITGAALASRLSLTSRWVFRATTVMGGATIGQTSASVARSVFPNSRTVVLVSSDARFAFETGLAAPLARSLQAPVLAVASNGVSPEVVAELQRRQVNRAIIVGSTGEVGAKTVAKLVAMKISLARITGKDRYATAVAVAKAMKTPKDSRVFVVGSADPTSLLLAAGSATGVRAPILLASPKGFDAATRSYLSTVNPRAVTVVGSSNAVETGWLKGLRGVTRFARATPADTATALAWAFRGNGTGAVVLVPSSPAAQARALTAVTLGSPVLIADGSLPPSTNAYIEISPRISRIMVVGTSVSSAVLQAASRT